MRFYVTSTKTVGVVARNVTGGQGDDRIMSTMSGQCGNGVESSNAAKRHLIMCSFILVWTLRDPLVENTIYMH